MLTQMSAMKALENIYKNKNKFQTDGYILFTMCKLK